MSSISLFALLGLTAIGASNLSLFVTLSFALIWLIGNIRKKLEFCPSPNLEAAIIFIGFLLARSLGNLQNVHLFVQLGNGLAIIQLLRMFRNLDYRGRMASLFISFMNKLLSQIGYQRLSNETPLEFARRIKQEGFSKTNEIEFLSWCFCRIRYGGETLTSHTEKEIGNSLLQIKELLSTKFSARFS